MTHELLNCPKDGRPMNLRYVSKWSDSLWLVFCHCGHAHEVVPTKQEADIKSE